MKEKDSFIHMVRLQDYGFTNVKNCNKLCTSSEKVLFLIAKENVLPFDINIFLNIFWDQVYDILGYLSETRFCNQILNLNIILKSYYNFWLPSPGHCPRSLTQWEPLWGYWKK